MEQNELVEKVIDGGKICTGDCEVCMMLGCEYQTKNTRLYDCREFNDSAHFEKHRAIFGDY